jgi:MoaA/NifB/PqqE/SkfB family radical SAM enzyme
MFHKDTFCILPWSSIQINPSGDFKICGFSGETGKDGKSLNHGMCLDENGKTMNVMTHSIMDALNSETHKKIRLAQSKNERHPMCKVCWDRDDANKNNEISSSLRFFRSFKQIHDLDGAINFEKVSDHLTEDGSVEQIPISLELRLSNTCNMKCIMCSSIYSNLWYEDEYKLYGNKNIIVDGKVYNIKQENGVWKSDMKVWHESENWKKEFELIKKNIRHLYIMGGEPFVIKGHDELLDNLIESGCSKNIILEYDTNLTVINKKILNKFEHFKKVVLSVSCDDIYEQFEYIRYPGKFDVMTKNLELLKEHGIKIRNLSTCIGIYSIYSPIRMYEHFTKLGYTPENSLYGKEMFSLRFLKWPSHANVALLPKKLKLKVIDLYRNSNLSERWKNFLCDYIENNMDTYSEELCVQSVKDHINYLNRLDEIRGTDWKKTFPEVVELLKDYV